MKVKFPSLFSSYMMMSNNLEVLNGKKMQSIVNKY